MKKNQKKIEKEKTIWRIVLLGGLVFIVIIIGFTKILDGVRGLVETYCINVSRFPVVRTPEEYGLSFEEITIEVEKGIEIKTWYLKGKFSEPLIILVPGYEGTRQAMLPFVNFLLQEGYSVLAIDPRGQGESGGECICGSYLAEDLQKIIEFFKEKGIGKFVLFGLSLGGVGSIIAGAQKSQEVLGVISDSAFANMREGFRKSPLCPARILFDNPLFYKILQFFSPIYIHNALGVYIDPTQKTNALLYVKEVRNILIIHGEKDKLIPVKNAYLLFEEAQKTEGIKQLWIYNGAHVEGWTKYPDIYQKKVLEFLKEIMEGL